MIAVHTVTMLLTLMLRNHLIGKKSNSLSVYLMIVLALRQWFSASGLLLRSNNPFTGVT